MPTRVSLDRHNSASRKKLRLEGGEFHQACWYCPFNGRDGNSKGDDDNTRQRNALPGTEERDVGLSGLEGFESVERSEYADP
jgi:hypothetical protein